METLLDILQHKAHHTPRPLVTVPPTASVLDATRLMNAERIGSLVVMQAGRLVGIFTERDVLRRVVAEARPPARTLVGDVMTSDVICSPPEAGVAEVADLMRRRRIRHVPVVDGDGKVLELVSIGDINAHQFNCCEVALHQVEDYVLRRA
jgi:CBS domain-containing protein